MCVILPDTIDINGNGFSVYIVVLLECNIIQQMNIILTNYCFMGDETYLCYLYIKYIYIRYKWCIDIYMYICTNVFISHRFTFCYMKL